MAKLKNPLLSFSASRSLGKALTFVKRRGANIVEKKPKPTDMKTPAQLSWRHMYQKAVALWHALSAEEKQDWESGARRKHMTGFAWFMSQCLRPNPGIYLPLQGGTMQGEIDMDKYRILRLPSPSDDQEPSTKKYIDDLLTLYLLLTGGTMTGDIALDAHKLVFANLLLKEDADEALAVRNLADDGHKTLKAYGVSVDSFFGALANNAAFYALPANNAVLRLMAWETGVGLATVARLVGAASPYFELTLPMVLTPSTEPGTPVEGHYWYDSGTDKLAYRDTSATQAVATEIDALMGGIIYG